MKRVCWKGIIASFLFIIAGATISYRQVLETDTVPKRGEENDEKSPELPPEIALTFDDGPHPVYTPMLLDGLKERGVKASFFLIGKNIRGREEIVERMDREGHLIGNHTYSHVKLTDLSVNMACEELIQTSQLVRKITGKDTEFMRPPFGEWEKAMEREIEMFPVLWNVDTRDWMTENVSEIILRGCEDIRDGSVILMHDCYESSVEAALAIVDELTARGYVFVTAEELMLE